MSEQAIEICDEVLRVWGLEGSYTEKKRRGISTGKFTVKFCTRRNEDTKRYDEVKRSVDSEKEAIARMASVTNFLNAEGGSPSGVAAFLDRAKAQRAQEVRTVNQVCEEFLAERRMNPRRIQENRRYQRNPRQARAPLRWQPHHQRHDA